MNAAQLAERFLALAIKAEAWASPIRESEAMDALTALDRLAVQFGRVVCADEEPLDLAAASRALYSIVHSFDRHTPDSHASSSALRIARKAHVAAYHLNRICTPPRPRETEETNQ